MSDFEKTKRYTELLGENSTPTETDPAVSFNVRGTGNIVSGGNVVVNETPIIVNTDRGVLDTSQKCFVNRLVEEWHDLECLYSGNDIPIIKHWQTLNRRMGVNSYTEIKSENYEETVSWLREQINRLLTTEGMNEKDKKWRKDRYEKIFARAKEYPGGGKRMRAFVFDNYGTRYLNHLSDAELETVYRHVHKWPPPPKGFAARPSITNPIMRFVRWLGRRPF